MSKKKEMLQLTSVISLMLEYNFCRMDSVAFQIFENLR